MSIKNKFFIAVLVCKTAIPALVFWEEHVSTR
jgi:hypothetical protein